jgi:hypothetical protein
MKVKFITILCACAGLLPGILSANIILGTYNFDDVISAINTANQITLSDFAKGPGVTGTFPDYSSLAVSGKSNLFYNAGFNSTDQAGAVSTNRYIGFSSEADVGYFVDYASISFYSLRRTDTGLGAPSDYALFASTDGFAAAVATGKISATEDDTFLLNTIDLSASAILQGVTDSVEFRLYLWRGPDLGLTTQRQLRIDDFSVSGSVSVVPEPAAYGFIGIAALVLVFWRRFRHRG